MKIKVGDFCDLVYDSGESNNVEYFFTDGSGIINDLLSYTDCSIKYIELDTVQETPIMNVYVEKKE